jgi:hypothetical protein
MVAATSHKASTLTLIWLTACCDPCKPIDECSVFVVGRGLDLRYESGSLTVGTVDSGDTADGGDSGDSGPVDDTGVPPRVHPTIEVRVERLDTGDTTSAMIDLAQAEDGTYTLSGTCSSPCEFVLAPDSDCGDHGWYEARVTFTLVLDGKPTTDKALQPVVVDLPATGVPVLANLWTDFVISCQLAQSAYC